jgi:hypothetical protein
MDLLRRINKNDSPEDEKVTTTATTQQSLEKPVINPSTPDTLGKKPNRFVVFIKRHKKPILIATPIIIAFGALIGIWFYYQQPTPTPAPAKVTSKAVSAPKPTTVADPLTGQQVSATAAAQPVVGVMIENLYPDARPQSGLSQAGVVYQALAEGGITRFLAIFQEPLPTSIGPVRSLRPYYLDWGLEYNIPVTHAGGSEPALAEIKPLGLKNIDALAYDGSYFFRTSDRAAPHNLYTNNADLSALVAKLGWATAPTFTPLMRKVDAPLATASHTKIDITFGTMAEYNVEWQYDATDNDYLFFQGGTAQDDRNTNLQITSKNIVVEFTPTSYTTQSDGKPETDINLIGSGKALVFEDGDAITATWSKASNSAQTVITDSTGAPVKFNAGNTWYEVVPTGSAVTD